MYDERAIYLLIFFRATTARGILQRTCSTMYDVYTMNEEEDLFVSRDILSRQDPKTGSNFTAFGTDIWLWCCVLRV